MKRPGFVGRLDPQESNENFEKPRDHTQRTIWAPFYKDSENIYPNDLALRVLRSPTHGSVIRSKHAYAVGNGLTGLDEDILEGWGKLYWRLILDFITSGNAYLEGVRVGGQIQWMHHDYTTVRKTWDGSNFLISRYWREIKNRQSWDNKQFPVDEVPAWDGKDRQGRFMLHLKNYNPEYAHYGVPDYGQGVQDWADIEYQIARFNLGRFKRGFMPSAWITLQGEAPDGWTAEQYEQALNDRFTGEANDNRLVVEFVGSPEMKADIHEFQGPRKGDFLEMKQLARESIVEGHSWFQSLIGIAQAGALGDRAALEVQYEAALNEVVMPRYQRPMLAFVAEALEISGVADTSELGVMQIQPTSVKGDIDPAQVLTIGQQQELLGQIGRAHV